MAKIFLDSDIILDVILDRKAFVAESAKILESCEFGTHKGFTSALILANIHYIISRQKIANPSAIISQIAEILKVSSLDEFDIQNSISSEFADFEDGIQHSIAVKSKCNFIITRNTKDYVASKLLACTPQEFLEFKS